MTVLFSLIPLVVPPSPTKCLAQAATLFLKRTLTENQAGIKKNEEKKLNIYPSGQAKMLF